jgi:hypothetical protein
VEDGHESKAKLSTKSHVYVLQNGIYQCKTRPMPFFINADGQDQKVTGYPYWDTISVKVIADHTIEMTSKKGGGITWTNKWTVSPDGNTLTNEFGDSTVPDVAPVTGKKNGSASPRDRPAPTSFRGLGGQRTGITLTTRSPSQVRLRATS